MSSENTNGSLSIYQQICENIKNGVLDPDFCLPDEERGFSPLRFAPGAFDGMCMYHMRHADLDEEGAAQMAAALKAAAAGDYPKADALFHDWAKKYGALGHIDELQKYVIDHADAMPPVNVHRVALSMVTMSPYIECVKVGLELLELFSEPQEDIKEIIRRLGLYDEFTLFSAWNMRRWKTGNAEIFELARKTNSWGRIHAVEQLEPETDEIRHWLLTKGTVNDVVNAYSALTCWRKSRAEEILFDHPTQEEFSGLITLIDALLDEGPVPGISAMDNAEGVLLRALELAPAYALTAEEYDTVLSVWYWAQHKEPPLPAVSEACDRLLRSPACLSAVEAAVTEGRALRLAEELDIPFRDQLLDCLRRDYDHHFYNIRYLLSDPAYTDAALALSREKLPLEDMKGDPTDDPCMGPEYLDHDKLQFILQELSDKPLTGIVFVKAGLESPAMRNRHHALGVLQEWVQETGTPLSELLPALYEAVLSLRDRETDDRNTNAIALLLSGRTSFVDEDGEGGE